MFGAAANFILLDQVPAINNDQIWKKESCWSNKAETGALCSGQLLEIHKQTSRWSVSMWRFANSPMWYVLM